MKKYRIIWQIFPSYLIITIFCLVAAAWYISISVRGFYIEQTSNDLLSRAHLIENEISEHLHRSDLNKLQRICKSLSASSVTRITVISTSGRVLCDSEENPDEMDNHATRDEISKALAGTTGNTVRYSATLGIDMMYAAIPLTRGNKPAGVLRTAVPLTSINEALIGAYVKIAIGGIIATFIAAGLGLLISRRISRPLVELKKGAMRFSKGDFSKRLPISNSAEIGMLAETLNHMASQLEKFETVRRDFVANVSHELKTPITSIKGFVETLIDGNTEGPEETEHFLEITLKQVDRLSAIIEDLLSLSRIEQDSENAGIPLENALIENIAAAAVQSCLRKAKAKHVRINEFYQEKIAAKVNPLLLEQAMVNLIDNAIKYSDEGKIISVRAIQIEGEVVISIHDQGFGIDSSHLSRIFERFYRVDKARSRKHGGTGLGLAIVKHIAVAHGGQVSVESAPGQGSIFALHLPVA